MPKERIVVYFEGDVDKLAQEERVSPDTIFDSLAHDLDEIAKRYGLESWIDETYFIDNVRQEG